MNILIMSVTAGFGHMATASAIKAALEERGAKAEIVDTLKYISPLLEKTVADGYLFSTKHLPRVYRRAYDILDKKNKDTSSTDVFQNIIIPEKFVSMIENSKPDLIICTHIFSAQIINMLKTKGRLRVRAIGVITDYTIHPMWQNVEHIDYIITASELLTLQAIKKGIPKERIVPLGIPANPKFNKSIPKTEARDKLGLDPDRPTILIMSGSMGFGRMAKTLETLEKLNLGVQIMTVCGTDKRQYNSLSKKNYGEHIKLYAFVDNIDEMMDAADFIITKPGGLTVTESLIKGLPMIMYNPIPGQEERNVDFLLNNGLALKASKHLPLDEAIFYLLERPERIELLRESIRLLAKPNAAADIADFTIKLGGEGE